MQSEELSWDYRRIYTLIGNLLKTFKKLNFFLGQLRNFFLFSTFLQNCFLCQLSQDRVHGDVPLWLGAALLFTLGLPLLGAYIMN